MAKRKWPYNWRPRWLAEWGLDWQRLHKLGRTLIELEVDFKPTTNLKPLLRLTPEKRVQAIVHNKRDRCRRTLKKWPGANVEIIGSEEFPRGLRSSVAAQDIVKIFTIPDIDYYPKIIRIPGRKRRTIIEPKVLRWYAVRARVAIQVEAQTKGLQHVEDRMMLIKAYSEADAKKRLAREWRQYAAPYLNDWGYLVRWQLEEITDIHEIFDDPINPKGTEVYSSLSSRRMKPKYIWYPLSKTRYKPEA